MANDELLACADVEWYAKLIGLLLQHWLIILFARAGMSSEVWFNSHKWSAMVPVLCWKLSQGTLRFSLPYKLSNKENEGRE